MDFTDDITPPTDSKTTRNYDLAPLPVPSEAESSQDKYGVVRYHWDVEAIITEAVRFVTGTGLLGISVHLSTVFGAVKAVSLLNLDVVKGTAPEAVQRKHGVMTDRSLKTITTLLDATGNHAPGEPLAASLMNRLFPAAGTGPVHSALVGQTVIARFTDGPDTRKRKDGTMPKPGTRTTTVSSYRRAS